MVYITGFSLHFILKGQHQIHWFKKNVLRLIKKVTFASNSYVVQAKLAFASITYFSICKKLFLLIKLYNFLSKVYLSISFFTVLCFFLVSLESSESVFLIKLNFISILLNSELTILWFSKCNSLILKLHLLVRNYALLIHNV